MRRIQKRSATDSELEKAIKAYVRNNIEKLLLTKDIDWESENEFRYIIYTPYGNDLLVPIEGALSAIIFGHTFPYLMEEKMIEVFKNPEVKMTKLHWQNGVASYTEISSNYVELKSIRFKNWIDIFLSKKFKK